MKDYKGLQNGSDIRGVAIKTEGGKPVNITLEAASDLTKAFCKWLSAKTGKKSEELVIALGRDSRLSGPALLDACKKAAAECGAKVLDCGMATTPAMFMATQFESVKADGSIMLTASHLPFERNGLKFFDKNGGLDKPDIADLIKIAETEEFKDAKAGSTAQLDLIDIYSKHLREVICKGLGAKEEDKPLSHMHIVVDAGNGAGGFYAEKVLKVLGANCEGSQFLNPDGTFPNHQPNPENEAAMQSVCAAVVNAKADLGIIFDTDVDRSAAVDENGKEIARNGIVALASVIASEGHPGTTIVTDSITSTQLGDFLTKDLKLKHLRFKRGYKNVINKGLELNKEGIDCQLSIETSGHAAMKENYFLDDGAYLGTKIVILAAKLKAEGKGISSVLETLKEPLEAKEIRFAVNCENFSDYAQTVLDDVKKSVEDGKVKGASLELPNYEGVRINFDKENGDGWLLIRKSLHDPVVPVNIESNKKGGVDEIFKALQTVIGKYEKLVK